jgi:mRNA interferase RelE/StbE
VPRKLCGDPSSPDLLADFDADFFKLPQAIQNRIDGAIDRLGRTLDTHSHMHMTGVPCYRLRVGDYRVLYDFDREKGVLHLLAIGHRREVYRK